jgi:hypothetical protein
LAGTALWDPLRCSRPTGGSRSQRASRSATTSCAQLAVAPGRAAVGGCLWLCDIGHCALGALHWLPGCPAATGLLHNEARNVRCQPYLFGPPKTRPPAPRTSRPPPTHRLPTAAAARCNCNYNHASRYSQAVQGPGAEVDRRSQSHGGLSQAHMCISPPTTTTHGLSFIRTAVLACCRRPRPHAALSPRSTWNLGLLIVVQAVYPG